MAGRRHQSQRSKDNIVSIHYDTTSRHRHRHSSPLVTMIAGIVAPRRSAPLAASTTIILIFLFTRIAVLCHGFSSFANDHSPQYDRGVRYRSRAAAVATSAPAATTTVMMTPTKTALSMGLVDYFREKFLDSRDGDFIPLEQVDDTAFGPGPLILMYAIPNSIDDEELRDMVQDGMPRRVVVREGGGSSSSSVIIRRISGMDENGSGGDEELLDASVGEALGMVMGESTQSSSTRSTAKYPHDLIVGSSPEQVGPCPVLYFSGVSNTEMMETYRIIANEIYQETKGVHWPACAKVVRPAMEKSLRQVLSEISSDHEDAMKMRREDAEEID